MKKLISLLLILATVMSCFMLTVSADEQIVSDEGRLPFEDIKDSHWFADQVTFCYANGVINGMNEYTFAWNGNLTRAQFVTMLANLEGVTTSSYSVDKFTDVKSNHWYYGAVAWAYSEGIVNGMTETTFQPNGILTRAQLATVMKNYMAKNEYAVEINEAALDGFSDKPKAEYWYYDAMVYAVSAGLLSGNSNGTLTATGNVTRAQAAVIFKSFMDVYFYGDCEHSFSEADCTNAETCTSCGLVNGLPKGHRLSAYDCSTGGVCMECNAVVDPSNILHDFAASTCTKPVTCTQCGETRGEAKGHNWWAATCVNPKMCKICYATEGNKLGHNYTGGKCTRCGEQSPYNKIVDDLINAPGTYVSEANSYAYTNQIYCGVASLIYSVDEDSLYLSFTGVYEDGAYDTTAIILPKTGHAKEFVYAYYDANGQCMFAGVGNIDPASVNDSTIPSFTEYEGSYGSLETARENAGFELNLALVNGMGMINHIRGVSLSDFGFVNYP